MLTLYQMQDSGNCYKIRLLLTQLEKNYHSVDINILEGESRTNDFLKKNINGRVPTLQIDETNYLPESNAILWYLSEGTPYIPEDKLARARVLQWMFFEQYSHEPYIATSRFLISITKQAKQYREQIASKRQGGEAALSVMDQHLATKDFFAGHTYSIADIALYAYTHVAHEGNFDLSPYAHIKQWLQRVKAQDRHITITA
ncbi:MAG: glutathione S-transferase family protein [Pseudomonadales bacterium]